jgi:hypothetical protein
MEFVYLSFRGEKRIFASTTPQLISSTSRAALLQFSSRCVKFMTQYHHSVVVVCIYLRIHLIISYKRAVNYKPHHMALLNCSTE